LITKSLSLNIIIFYWIKLKVSVLTSVSGIIFGFLLNISINSPSGFSTEDSLILMIALYSISFAVSLFVMPIVYHHLQYPYKDIEKFKIRSHRFIKIGLIPAAITLYLGLLLGLKFSIHIGVEPKYENFAYVLAIVPFLLACIFFINRK
jgi:hypothetical protein